MKDNSYRPIFKKKVKIVGPCLFLVGPIGSFFSRLSRYLENKDVKTYKIQFPLHEYGFPKFKTIAYSKEIDYFKDFLRKIILEKKIKHIFMYGNVLIPHRHAIELVEEFKTEGIQIYAHIFELGYLRPNFVTLEDKGVNYESSFILNKEFFSQQEPYKVFPLARDKGLRLRKIWKSITFINHSFKKYKIVEFEHKLQPKPIYLWFQLKGFLLKYYYRIKENKIKRRIFSENPFFIVILQVSSDSQITKGSKIGDIYQFIEYVIKKFSKSNVKNTNLIFKHHPRDRGYNNYSELITINAKKYGIQNEVFYIHDCYLSNVFRNPNCKGTILINSTVGYQSLYHSVPVKSFGISPYNINGITYQKNLISFFNDPETVDKLLFNKFYKYLLENSQINGNFDGFFPFSKVFTF